MFVILLVIGMGILCFLTGDMTAFIALAATLVIGLGLAGILYHICLLYTSLESYAHQKGYTNCQHYTDDGWSGGNFERPAWKQLIADIEAGKVAHVIVKDMSRVGRDYLQTGFYTEVFFRQHHVHFVAIRCV